MDLDTYYQHCEDAVRCQAAGQPLGVYCHLAEAARILDSLVEQARVRLELGLIRGLLDYWDGTLGSLTYAKRTGKAAIYIPLSLEPSDTSVHVATLGCIREEEQP